MMERLPSPTNNLAIQLAKDIASLGVVLIVIFALYGYLPEIERLLK